MEVPRCRWDISNFEINTHQPSYLVSMRTESLIVLCVVLVFQIILAFSQSVLLMVAAIAALIVSVDSLTACRILYYLTYSIIGIKVCRRGIHGIQKDIPEYLNGIISYLSYSIIFQCFGIAILIFTPPLYYKFFTFDSFGVEEKSEVPDNILVLVLAFLFTIALTYYFASILKNYRNDMMIRKINNPVKDIFSPLMYNYYRHRGDFREPS